MAKLKVLLGVMALLVAAGAPAQERWRGLEREGLSIYYEARDEAFAQNALAAALEALPRLESALELTPQKPSTRRPIRIEIAHTMADFNRLVGVEMKPWTEGVALPGRHIVLQALAPANLKVVVAHELTHVLLDEVADRLRVTPPRWLHEGLAKYATGDFTESDRQVLGQAVVERNLIALKDLERAFDGNRDRVALAYAQSYTLVRYLEELQAGSSGHFLGELALTGDPDRALLRTYGRPTAQLEAEWLRQVRGEYLKHGVELSAESLLFGLMALIFVGVYLVVRRRRRLIRERLQEEERLRRMLGEEDYDEPDEVELPADY